MTRKEELAKRAKDLVIEINEIKPEQCDYNDEIDCELMLEALVQVEREVWARVDRYYSNQVHYDMDDYPDKFVKWLRTQQQELG